MADPQGSQYVTREQKTGFVLLLIFGILTVGLGVLQMRNTIFNPFAREPIDQNAVAHALQQDPNIVLQQIDTDQDGLNDYDELNFHNTSPYLPDTDSDGVRDKDELDAGTDPTCAEGTACDVAEAVPEDGNTISGTPLADQGAIPLDALAGLEGALGATTTLGISNLANDPSALRAMLIDSGQVTASDLANIDDATLMELFNSVLTDEITTLQEPAE